MFHSRSTGLRPDKAKPRFKAQRTVVREHLKRGFNAVWPTTRRSAARLRNLAVAVFVLLTTSAVAKLITANLLVVTRRGKSRHGHFTFGLQLWLVQSGGFGVLELHAR